MTFPLVTAALGLAEFVPSLTRLFGGSRAPEIAQQVIDIAKQVTGASSPVEAIRLLEQNSFLVVEFQKEILRREADLDFSLLQDRADARAREVALSVSGQRNRRADIMVCASAIGLILCLGTLGYGSDHLPGEAVGIISTIAGIFGACLKDAYAFEFGSSRGSKEKDITVTALLKKSAAL